MLDLHEVHTGVLSISPELEVSNDVELAEAYTPGVAELSLLIKDNHELSRKFTISGKLIAVVTDGSAVLGLGNVGTKAGLPIVEGKSLLYKTFANVDAIPIGIDQVDVVEFVKTVHNISSSFGGIHLEDIKAPKCFEIEDELQKQLDIPVYHDDQEGTAIAVLAGLINAAKVAKKELTELSVVINGIGASGLATAKLLYSAGISRLTLVDKQGILVKNDKSLNFYQRQLVEKINSDHDGGDLSKAIFQKDVFIGLSEGNIVTKEMIQSMNPNPIVFALANPIPEITPKKAKEGGASIIATGSSIYPNQINNVLVFPGLFKGLLESGGKKVTLDLQNQVANALASMIEDPTEDKFIPQVFDSGVAEKVSQAVCSFFYKK